MIEATGGNRFNGIFDFFKWNAPYYENPKEVIRALQTIPYKGKHIKSIRIIGAAHDVGNINNGLLYRKITDAGIHLEDNWWNTYPNIDHVMLPWEAEVCEPIQFIFEDNTTLEVLPIGCGGARIATNSIPLDVQDGLNRSNFDANMFFLEALGKKIDSTRMYIEKNSKQYIDDYSIDMEKSYEEVQKTYRFTFDLGNPYKINLVQTRASWYKVTMQGSGRDSQVPYSRVKASKKENDQILIVNGRDSRGTFWICPCNSKSNDNGEEHIFFDNFGMSIDDYYVSEFLTEFLYKYFDPKIQKKDESLPDNSREFDWYGVNLYLSGIMKTMVQDINDTASRLTENADDPSLRKIINRFSCWDYTGKHKSQLTDEESFLLKKKRIPTAVDFYNRFTKRTESMLGLPWVEFVSFSGP